MRREDRTCQEAFEAWACDQDLCLDQLFMSSFGVPRNPYEDEVTHNVYAVWLAAWDACKAAAVAEAAR